MAKQLSRDEMVAYLVPECLAERWRATLLACPLGELRAMYDQAKADGEEMERKGRLAFMWDHDRIAG